MVFVIAKEGSESDMFFVKADSEAKLKRRIKFLEGENIVRVLTDNEVSALYYGRFIVIG